VVGIVDAKQAVMIDTRTGLALDGSDPFSFAVADPWTAAGDALAVVGGDDDRAVWRD
jgi:hypothetical protein